ncbi:MAG: ABC transporter permease [Hyphomicrobiales bacterium]
MIRLYIKTALRNILKNKLASIISILGLALGLTVTILLFSYVRYERSYDTFNKKYDRIHYMSMKLDINETTEVYPSVGFLVLEDLLSDYPEIESGTRVAGGSYGVEIEGKDYAEDKVRYVDTGFFDVFTVNFIKGSAKDFNEPHTIILTRKIAEKYFGTTDVVGKFIKTKTKSSLKIIGVIEDQPSNSIFEYEALLPISLYKKYRVNPHMYNYTSGVLNMFFVIKEGVDLPKLKEKVTGFYNDKFDNEELNVRGVIKHINEWHLGKDNQNLGQLLLLLSFVGLIILLVSSFNYINLYVSVAYKRRRAVALHQVYGANKRKIVISMIIEAIIISFLAFDIAFLISERMLDTFNLVINSEVPRSFLFAPEFVLSILGISLLIGIVSGIFPGIKVLSSDLIKSLKGITVSGKGYKGAHPSLIIIQYVVVISLLICIIGINMQFHYLKDKDLGFRDGEVLFAEINPSSRSDQQKMISFKNKCLQVKGVKGVSTSSQAIFDDLNTNGLTKKRDSKRENTFLGYTNWIDNNYLEVYDLKLKEGNPFSQEYSAKAYDECYINETVVKKLGLESPVGQKVYLGGLPVIVRGVVEDYHLYSSMEEIPPVVLHHMPKNFILNNCINIYCDRSNIDEVKEELDVLLRNNFPSALGPFEKVSQEKSNEGKFTQLASLEKMFLFFTVIGLLIAAIGIFGSVALSLNSKNKELGIRKVLGCSPFPIFYLVTKSYILQVLLGNIISWPLAYYALSYLLEKYPYRVDIEIYFFVLPLFIILFVVLITTSYHVVRAIKLNPVDVIKSE